MYHGAQDADYLLGDVLLRDRLLSRRGEQRLVLVQVALAVEGKHTHGTTETSTAKHASNKTHTAH